MENRLLVPPAPCRLLLPSAPAVCSCRLLLPSAPAACSCLLAPSLVPCCTTIHPRQYTTLTETYSLPRRLTASVNSIHQEDGEMVFMRDSNTRSRVLLLVT